MMTPDAAFLAFNRAVLSLTCALGLLANLLVCWVVFRNRNLRTSNHALLVSLAASDLLKCSVDTPLLLLLSFLREVRHPWVRALRALQQLCYALCSCVQLLTLVGISVERFHAIAFPFRAESRRTRIRLWIPSIWVCGVLLAAVSLTLSRRTPWGGGAGPLVVAPEEEEEEQQQQQPRYADPFGAYVLVPVWGVSLTLIVVYYARIFKVVRQHRTRVYDHGIQLRPTARQVWRWFSFAGSEPGTAPHPAPPPPPAHPGLNNLKLLPAMCWPASGSTPPQCRLITVAEAAGPSRAGSALHGRSLRRPPAEIAGAVCLLTPLARERGKKRVEGKLAQRFGYIIIVFTLFWVPMVVTLLMNIMSWQNTNSLVVELETSAMVLTCVPAAVDPLIYTMVTRQFRSELSKILSSLSVLPRRFKG
ncbi:unnamed protein product [Merluccius merluccius]